MRKTLKSNNVSQTGWICINDANIPFWNNNMTLNTIEKETFGQTIVFAPQCGQCIQYQPKLWYTESRNFLLSCGITPISDIALLAKDTCFYRDLYLNDHLYQKQSIKNTSDDYERSHYFMGTSAPAILTKIPIDTNDCKDNEQKYQVIFWGTNTVKSMLFSGCATLSERLTDKIEYVCKMYEGILNQAQIDQFLKGIQPEVEEEFKLEPLPTVDFLMEQIIKYNITKYNIHNCSFCDYECGYIFTTNNTKIEVRYDNGCYCYRVAPKLRNLEDVIEHMSIQNKKNAIDDIKQFWHLE